MLTPIMPDLKQKPVRLGRSKPRYHPAWPLPARSIQLPSILAIGCAVIAALALRTTSRWHSPARLGRELLPGLPPPGSQSLPWRPCLALLAYFPLSLPCFSKGNYLLNENLVKAFVLVHLKCYRDNIVRSNENVTGADDERTRSNGY